nr:alpha/beta hydrolase [Paraglaciecola sp. G1-23]
MGDPNKPMILALHGWLDNAASFVPIANYLVDYYIVAIDLVGHGKSTHRSADAHYHLVDYVHDVHELVTSQKWSPFILMGHSMGGIIASLYASTFNSNVQSLICIESFGPMTKSATSSPEQLQDAILSRLNSQSAKLKPLKSLQGTVKARAMIGEMSFSSAELLIERNLKRQDEQLVFSSDKRLRTLSSLRMTEEQAEAFMGNIQCPVLVISAIQGFEFVKQAISDRLGWVSNIQHSSCDGFHHFHMDNPARVAEQMVNFLIGNSGIK